MSSALKNLAAAIPAQIATLTELFKTNGLPEPSFDESRSVDIGAIGEEPRELLEARNTLINQAHDLLMLARGPVDHVVSMGYAVRSASAAWRQVLCGRLQADGILQAVDTAALGTISRFEIPSKVPSNSTISLTELSTATGLPESELVRTIRYAITKGLFTEAEPGKFGHSAASATLARNKNLSNMTLFNSGFSTRIVVCLADALWAKHGLKLSDAPDAAFNEAYHGYVNLFDYMGKSPDQSREYFNYLDARSQLPRYRTGHIHKLWNWQSVGSGTIVDVSQPCGPTYATMCQYINSALEQAGGSAGQSAIEIAKYLPQARVVVQDINTEGLKMGRELVSKDPDLRERVTFMEHNLFDPQKIEADVYFFRHIIHDWPDKECIRMIQALLPSLKDGARVLLSEGTMPQRNAGRTALLDDIDIL